MSNLGWYQWFTSNAKKVGGPLNLMGLIAIGGYAVIRVGEAGTKKVIKLARAHNKNKSEEILRSSPIYNVVEDTTIGDDVAVKVGDRIRVCAIDHNVAMIEILGNKNNPYFVDFDLLKSITDYK